MGVGYKFSKRMFNSVHSNNLIYNQCWEDPRLDRQAMKLTNDDNLMVITSAGCNVLDYALDNPGHIYAVDMNPRQNALLELKIAAIRALDYEDFFNLFGNGCHPAVKELYQNSIRKKLPEFARKYWDKNLDFFDGKGWRDSFYFRGTSGIFARLINTYIDRVLKARGYIDSLLNSKSVEEQKDIYDTHLKEIFWSKYMRKMAGSDFFMSLLGVPKAQKNQVETHYGSIVRFIEDCLEYVFACLPLHDNYFWRVYLCGSYTPECCPEYLKPGNFKLLKNGLVDNISTHTSTIQNFLEKDDTPEINRFVLLDHMDWLCHDMLNILQMEWQAIVNKAADNARILWRSGGLKFDYVNPLQVVVGKQQTTVGELLNYNIEQAASLHQKDRVHTYGSFYIADMCAI